MQKKKNLAQFSENYVSFYPKICHQALKNMGLGSGIRDPRSGIRKKPIPDPGSRGQKGTGSGIPDPQHCIQVADTHTGRHKQIQIAAKDMGRQKNTYTSSYTYGQAKTDTSNSYTYGQAKTDTSSGYTYGQAKY